jgi:hypothetical protein
MIGAWPRQLLAQGEGDEEARALFIEGSKLGKQGRWEEARARYSASLKLRPAPLTRYSLGVAQRETGHLADALASFRLFLAEAPSTATLPYVPPAQAALAELRTQVGKLALVVGPRPMDGLSLTLDGEAIEQAPLRDIDPGAHEIIARAPGFQEGSARFVARAASLSSLTLTLVASAGALAAPGASSQAARDTGLAPRPVLSFALLGGGGALLLTGTIVGLVAVKHAGDAPTRNGPEARSARSMGIAADVLAGAGLITAGVGVVLLLTQKAAPPAQKGAVRASMDAPGAPGFALQF